MSQGEFWVEVHGSEEIRAMVEPVIERALRAAGARLLPPERHLSVVGEDAARPSPQRVRSEIARRRRPI